MNTLWEITFKNSILGSISPTTDPFWSETFLVADGNGSMYASMRLRRVEFATGKEVANVLLRGFVRCLCFSPEGKFILAITDNKIFQLDRQTLQIIEKFDKQVPKYSDYVAIDDKGNLVLMNYAGKTIAVYNYLEKKLLQKKITKKDWCCNIIAENADNYLIFSSKTGTVQRYNLPKNSLEIVLETNVFCQGTTDKKGNFYFQLGKFIKGGSMSTDVLNPLKEILIVSPEKEQKTYQYEHYFKQIRLSQDEKSLFLFGENKIWQFSLEKETIVSEIVSPKNTSIIDFIEEKQMILAVVHQTEDKRVMSLTASP